MRQSLFLSALVFFMLTAGTYAQESMGQPGGRPGDDGEGPSSMMPQDIQDASRAMHKKRIPPQVALDACTGKSEGSACQFTGHMGTKTGTCVYTPDRQYFACRPSDMRMPGQGQEGESGIQGMMKKENQKMQGGLY